MNDRSITRVREVMKPEFDLIDGMVTVADALRGMKHVENKSFIVDKRDDNDEYGLLLISDIARRVLGDDRAAERVNVYEIMAKPVITVDPEMDIRYCARMFERFELTRAPVVKRQGCRHRQLHGSRSAGPIHSPLTPCSLRIN